MLECVCVCGCLFVILTVCVCVCVIINDANIWRGSRKDYAVIREICTQVHVLIQRVLNIS